MAYVNVIEQIVRRAETEPPSTMMLSHFSEGNPIRSGE